MAAFVDELAEVLQAARVNDTARMGFLDRAAGFGIVPAVAEAAQAEEGAELGEAVFDFLRR
jgi:hypothetical protein